jgi:hypothetical protein
LRGFFSVERNSVSIIPDELLRSDLRTTTGTSFSSLLGNFGQISLMPLH